MFSSQGAASSPFRASGGSVFAPQQSQQQQHPAQHQNGAFAQQAFGQSTPYSTTSGHTGQSSTSYFGTPQYGAQGGWSSPAGGAGPGYGQQSGQIGFNSNGALPGMNNTAGNTSSYGDKPKRNYLPGYLSGGAMAQAESTPPQNNDDSRSWDSPVRRTSISGSPATRFGGQSLFGGRDGTPSRSPKTTQYGRERLAGAGASIASRTEMEEDAPPISSLGEYDGNDSMSSLQPDVSNSALSTSPAGNSNDNNNHTAPAAPGGYAVYIFGFPSSALDLVLEYFSQFGEIVSSAPSTEGGNWVTVAYAQPWSASRAARRNGEVLGGALMVGVKAIDEDGLRRALLASEGGGNNGEKDIIASTSTSRNIPPPVTSGTPSSSLGKPVAVLGPNSAFKAPAPTPPRRGFFGVGGGPVPAPAVTSSTPSRDPHASLFAQKSQQAVMQQQQQGQASKGVLGKVSDVIFGW